MGVINRNFGLIGIPRAPATGGSIIGATNAATANIYERERRREEKRGEERRREEKI